MKRFEFLKAFNSPFKRPKLKFYFGKIALGTPYFYPRRWKKVTHNEALESAQEEFWKLNGKVSLEQLYRDKRNRLKAIPKTVGYDIVDLGWKTKWGYYRFEWSPMFSFVFFGLQFAIIVVAEDHYWEPWLYYNYVTDTSLSQEERIKQCIKENPCTLVIYNNGQKTTINYYTKILKDKYQYLVA